MNEFQKSVIGELIYPSEKHRVYMFVCGWVWVGLVWVRKKENIICIRKEKQTNGMPETLCVSWLVSAWYREREIEREWVSESKRKRWERERERERQFVLTSVSYRGMGILEVYKAEMIWCAKPFFNLTDSTKQQRRIPTEKQISKSK